MQVIPSRRSAVAIVAAILILSCGAERSWGQSRTIIARDFRPAGPFIMLDIAAVQNELKLKDEQKAKARERAKDVVAELRKGGQAARGKAASDARKEVAKLSEKAAADILTAQQQARLRQIFYQWCGINALSDLDAAYPSLDPVREAVKLSPDQKDRVQALAGAYQRERSEILRRDSTVPQQDRPAKVLALMTKYREQVTEVLTDEQKRA